MMIITYHGAESLKVSFGDTTLAFNPISKDSSLKQTKFGADICLISLEHPDTNGVEQVTYNGKEPLVIRGPGEYEKNDVLVKGYPTVSQYGGNERINTAYLVMLEKMHLLYLGAISTRILPTELKEALDSVDIVFIPIGGEGVLEPDDAYAFAVSMEPKIIIPKINVEIPAVYTEPAVDEGAVQRALEGGVLHYATSSNPGEVGNAVYFGHSSNNILNRGKYKFAFVLLNRLEPGDTFMLEKDSRRYIYKVTEKKIVEPNNLSVLDDHDKPTATLITCDPPGTSLKRLIVIGEQISPDPGSNVASTANKSVATPELLPSNAPTLWNRFWTWIST